MTTPAPIPDPIPMEPSHVMTRAHYERLAREAAEQQKN